MVDILIGDRRPLVIDLLASVLHEHGYKPIWVGMTASDLLTEVERRRPGICLVDHRTLAGGDVGFLSALRAAASEHTKIVLLSKLPAGSATTTTAETLQVDGVVDKRASTQSLIDGLDAVLAGETITVVPVAPDSPTAEDASWFRHLAADLTRRERECLALLVDGCTTEQIQDALSVSVMTVRAHVRSLLRKLGAHSRLEAASLAVRYQLLDDDRIAPAAG